MTAPVLHRETADVAKPSNRLKLTAVEIMQEFFAPRRGNVEVLPRPEKLLEVMVDVARSGKSLDAVSYTHLTLPTTPYV